MIIGLTGTLRAGKGTLVEVLKENDFKNYSVREFLIKEIEKRNKQVNKDNMVLIANQLREMHSPSYIVEQLYEQAREKGKDSVIESIRTEGEVDFLRKYGREDFFLIAVDADQKIRYDRAVKAQSETDNVSFEEFVEQEKKEMFSLDPAKQSLGLCMDYSDYFFMNNFPTIEEAKKEFAEGKKGFINLIKGQKRRPSFDEEYMTAAYNFSKRSTCLRRNTGAVIAKNNIFVSEGYNGAPEGSPHCTDIGECLREKLNIPSGMRDEICRAIHAEINAILNAPTKDERKGAIMYATTSPCTSCARIISNSGIKKVFYSSQYNAPETKKILDDAGIEIEKFSGVMPSAFNKFW